jgi:hypothetical protein
MTGRDLIEQLKALGEEALGQEVQLDVPTGRYVATVVNYDPVETVERMRRELER